MKKLQLIILILVSIGIFAASYRPVAEYDTYFGIKIGEQIIKTGHISPIEDFSWSAKGRSSYMYEWLAHVWVYLLTQLGNITAISIYNSISAVCIALLLYRLFRMHATGFWMSVFLTLVTYAGMYEFIVARPQLISFIGFLIVLLSCLTTLRFAPLLVAIVIYIWTNSHASFPLALYMLGSYAIMYLILRDKQKFFSLLFTLLASSIATILPPISFQPYKLIIEFMQDMAFLSYFINEWRPLWSVNYLFYSYLVIVILTLALYIPMLVIPSRIRQILLTLPLLPFLIMPFTALRHVPYAIISCACVIMFALPYAKHTVYRVVQILGCVLLTVALFQIHAKRTMLLEAASRMPTGAVTFLKQHTIHGRMYNQLGIGGYVIYELYPTYHVYFDGRAEVYHRHEMRSFYPILLAKTAPYEEFKSAVLHFMNSNAFSFALLPLYEHNPTTPSSNERLADVLLDLPDWSLVYIDDQSVLFVKRDGQNDQLIQDFALDGITPYRSMFIKQPEIQHAQSALKTLVKNYDSSIAEYILGVTYLNQSDLIKAETVFNASLALQPNNALARAGLGYVYIQTHRVDSGIQYLKDAIKIAPYRGQMYVWLSKAYLESGDTQNAIAVLRQGLTQEIDLLDRKTILQSLARISQ